MEFANKIPYVACNPRKRLYLWLCQCLINNNKIALSGAVLRNCEAHFVLQKVEELISKILNIA